MTVRSMVATGLVLAACSEDPALLERINRAKSLDASLVATKLDPLVEFWSASDEVLKTLKPQNLSAQQTCGGETFTVVYSPAHDTITFVFSDPGALTQSIRELTLNGKVAWRATEKAPRLKYLTDFFNAPRGESVQFRGATETLPGFFPADSDLTLEVGALSETAQRKGNDGFVYVMKKFRPRRVRVHTLSKTVSVELAAWQARVAPLAGRLHVLESSASRYPSLRSEQHPEVKAAVKHYDDLVAATKSARAAAGDAPWTQWKASVAIDACDETGTAASPSRGPSGTAAGP